MEKTILMLLRCVCPDQIQNQEEWCRKLNLVLKSIYNKSDYMCRVKLLTTYLRKNGDNLYHIPISKLVVMDAAELAVGMRKPTVI